MERDIDIYPIKLVIPGNAIVKKNTAKTSLFMRDKRSGKLIARPAPVHYYSEEYIRWAADAMQICYNFKNKHPEIPFPLSDRVNLKCMFYYNKLITVDQSALYEGLQDVLAGKSGLKDKSYLSLHPESYQILLDDSVRYVGGHDGSRWVLEYINPRTEITITLLRDY